jgi:hypothetical protein
MAKEDAACNNIFKTFMATIEGSAADDAAFVQSLNDAVDLLTAPLELEQVESTFSRESSHVTEVVVMRERIQAYEEHVKSHEAAMAAYWRDWEDMQDKFLQLGVEVLGKDAFAATEATDIAMTDAFIQKMERIHIDHNAMVDDLAIKMQAVEAGLMDEQRTIEEVSQSLSLSLPIILLTLGRSSRPVLETPRPCSSNLSSKTAAFTKATTPCTVFIAYFVIALAFIFGVCFSTDC